MIRRLDRFAVGHALIDADDLAGQVGFDDVGAELVADPEPVADDLEAFGVEVGAGQIALVGVFVDDAERHLLVRIVQEHGLLAVDRAGRPVDLVVVEIQHRIGRVVARAEAVVGQHPEGAVRHRLDAGMALQRLALERHRHAGRTAVGLAHHAALRFDALPGGVLARGLQIGRRIGRRVDERGRRQHRMAGEGGGKFAFGLRQRGGRRQRKDRDRTEQ